MTLSREFCGVVCRTTEDRQSCTLACEPISGVGEAILNADTSEESSGNRWGRIIAVFALFGLAAYIGRKVAHRR